MTVKSTTNEMLNGEPQLEAENEELQGKINKLQQEIEAISVEIEGLRRRPEPDRLDVWALLYWSYSGEAWICHGAYPDRKRATQSLDWLIDHGEVARIVHIEEPPGSEIK